MKKFIFNNKQIQKMAYWIVKKKKLLANPDLYIECKKRTINERFFLNDKHLKDCKVLSCREKLLEYMPKNGVCAEVGVAEGFFSEKILEICKPFKLYLIEYDQGNCIKLREKFKK